MKGIVKWFILSILAMTLFLIPVRVCQGEDLAPKKHQGEMTLSRHQISQGEDTIHTQIHFRDVGPKEIPKGEYAFSYGLFVHHYESEKANEGFENRMLAFEYKNIVVSYFDNSYNEDTVFLGYAFHTDKVRNQDFKDWWVRGNLYVGGLVGYGEKNPCNYHGLGLGVYPTASLGYKQTSVEMGVMPTFMWWALKYEF